MVAAYTLLISYGISSLVFLGAAVLLLVSRARNPYKHVLVTAVLLSIAWSACIALSPWFSTLVLVGNVLEPVRSLSWIGVAGLLLHRIGTAHGDRGFLIMVLGVASVSAAAIAVYWIATLIAGVKVSDVFLQAIFAANLIVAVSGILLVENLFRNADDETRWAIKHLCFGLAALFTYDFFMSAEAALFARLDQNLFTARGLVNALATSLIIVSAGRSKDWPIDIHVSRRVVFHTVTLLVGGAYLLVMALTGYAVGSIDATWSGPLQVTFFAAAVIVLVVVFSSGSVRAWVRRFIAENFFSYKYDYRDEWLRFIDQVAAIDQKTTIAERIVRAMAKMVESTSGVLWVYRPDDDAYTPSARWNISQALPSMAVDTPLPHLLSQEPAVIEVAEKLVALPDAIEKIEQAWLVVPLTHRQRLLAILVLGQPRALRKLDWEDKQLLLTAGSQAASYLAEDILAQDLLLARRFEDLNRRFAFVVHDIKNLTGQMSLLVQNADRYGDNPEFQKDMLATVRDGLDRMKRLLVKLKAGPGRLSDGQSLIELSQLIRSLEADWERQGAELALNLSDVAVRIKGEEEQLASALNQLVQNAVEAMGGGGTIQLELSSVENQAIILIKDNGPGMDSDFLEHKLFNPMSSTKADGYGIGAYQVREIVKDMGGRLTVNSEVGAGTTFRMEFPIALDKAPLMVRNAHG